MDGDEEMAECMRGRGYRGHGKEWKVEIEMERWRDKLSGEGGERADRAHALT